MYVSSVIKSYARVRKILGPGVRSGEQSRISKKSLSFQLVIDYFSD